MEMMSSSREIKMLVYSHYSCRHIVGWAKVWAGNDNKASLPWTSVWSATDCQTRGGAEGQQ